ncbi:MAG: 50S ribosomal protein L1 [Puniceicoccaceae bacterium]
MVRINKKYKSAVEFRGATPAETLDEAFERLQQMPKAKFDETVELSIHLGVDPRQSNHMVRGTVSLPHGSGKTVRVLAFTERPEAAIEAGAEYAGLDDYIEKILEGWLDFDVAVATPAAMKEVRKVARVLGPRGLMPNPKSGTVTDDVAAAISEVKAGRVEFKMDKTANVAIVIGKRSFDKAMLIGNAEAAIESLGKARPDTYKGRFVKSVAISATMSPSIKLDGVIYNKF